LERLERAFALLDRYVSQQGVKGAGLVVAQGGEIVGERYIGCATPDRPAGVDTLWPLASISKLYTAAAAMALVEAGEITFGARAAAILPEFTKDGRDKITLRHLLTHTSGLPYESPQMADRLQAQLSLEEILREAFDCELLFAPGTNQVYSDYGIGLAGLICAKVAGLSFPELVRQTVIAPAGLVDTYMPPPESVYDRIAQIEGPLAEGTPGAMYNSAYARALAHPAFGTIASARDLLKFGLLFDPNRERRLFSPIATMTMVTDQTGLDFPDELTEPMSPAVRAWGIGFHVKGRMAFPELASPAAFGHPGATGCLLLVDPVLDIAFAFVSNRHLNTSMDDWNSRLSAIANVVMSSMTREPRP
jgi:CubicO group peptidase (beta-lactamase class C family)